MGRRTHSSWTAKAVCLCSTLLSYFCRNQSSPFGDFIHSCSCWAAAALLSNTQSSHLSSGATAGACTGRWRWRTPRPAGRVASSRHSPSLKPTRSTGPLVVVPASLEINAARAREPRWRTCLASGNWTTRRGRRPLAGALGANPRRSREDTFWGPVPAEPAAGHSRIAQRVGTVNKRRLSEIRSPPGCRGAGRR